MHSALASPAIPRRRSPPVSPMTTCPAVRRRLLAGLAVWLPTVATAADVDWPQWRGPEGQGHAAAARDLPVTWSETENVAWKTPLAGRGWSSPVIGDSRIWLTTAIERAATPGEKAQALAGNRMAGQLEVSESVTIRAVCLDQTSGAILHDVGLFTIHNPQPIHKLNSFASPSPVLAGGRLFCHCGDFGVACLDAASGEILWRNRDLRLNHENGPGSTPVVWQDKLIVHLDGSDVQSIAAYDTASGQIAWRTTRSGTLRDDPQPKKAYGTPLILPLSSSRRRPTGSTRTIPPRAKNAGR